MNNVTNIAELEGDRSDERRFPKDMLDRCPNLEHMKNIQKIQNAFPINLEMTGKYKEYLKNSVVCKWCKSEIGNSQCPNCCTDVF